MTKYIVSGYIGFDNFGDELIARLLTRKLKSGGAEKITLISASPEKTSKLHGVNSCSMFGFLKPLLEADVLISGGGSLLQDVTSFKSLMYYLCVIFAAILAGKKVIIFAQGIGPVNSAAGQILTRFALKRCSEISVRDRESQVLLKNWGIDSALVRDPVFDLEMPVKNICGALGIQLRDCPALTDGFLNALAKEVLKYFADKKIKILSFQDSIDLKICEKFADILKKKGGADTKILSGLSADEILDEISQLEYLIGMRFHACVIGIKSGIKTLAVNYDIKIKKLAEEYNLPMIELDRTDFSKELERLRIQR